MVFLVRSSGFVCSRERERESGGRKAMPFFIFKVEIASVHVLLELSDRDL